MLLLLSLLHSSFSLEITFGSCAGFFDAENPEIWKSIKSLNPEAFIWLGDIIYADHTSCPLYFRVPSEDIWREKYMKIKNAEGYKDLRETTQILGIWDDHDYGKNNEDRFFPYKGLSKKLFLEFLDEPQDSERYKREGIYASYDFFSGDLLVKVILLDDRTYLDPPGKDGDTLGDVQWLWLEEEMEKKVDLFLIMNGIQINVEDRISITEVWHEKSRKRMLKILEKHPNSILVSGDVHYSEMLEVTCSGLRVFEFTSSGLTHSIQNNYGPLSEIFISLWYPYTYNIIPRRKFKSFGSIEVENNGVITMKIIDTYGNVSDAYQLHLNDLYKPVSPSYTCFQSPTQRITNHLLSISLIFLLPVSLWFISILKFLIKYSQSY